LPEQSFANKLTKYSKVSWTFLQKACQSTFNIYSITFSLPKWQTRFMLVIFKRDFFFFACTGAKKAVILRVI